MTLLLHALVSDAARAAPGHLAVAGDPPAAYYELERRIGDFADALRRAGLAGGRVGLLLPNVPAFPVAFFGTLKAGAGAVMLNPLYSRREIGEYLEDSGARAVVTAEALEHLVPPGIPKLCVDPSDGSVEIDFDVDVPPAADGRDPLAVPGGDREAAVIYTSAQGGWARGARLTHRSLGTNLRGVIEAMQLKSDDRVLAVAPFIHAFGLTVTLNAPLACGATVIPVERFNAARLLDVLESSGATVLAGVPGMFLALVAAAEKRGVPAHSLRIAICGGAPLQGEVQRRWEDTFGLPLREGYGLTEASPVCLFNRVDRPNRPGTMGYPFPGVSVTIRDAAGNALDAGEKGELCVEGANVFAGYVGDDGRPQALFFDDALRTGDLASLEPDGTFRFRGVLKRMFTRSGFNIYPREIERVIEEDPRVAEASVNAAPDQAKENEIVLTVVPEPGADLTEADVKQICRECLAAYKQPGRIIIDGE